MAIRNQIQSLSHMLYCFRTYIYCGLVDWFTWTCMYACMYVRVMTQSVHVMQVHCMRMPFTLSSCNVAVHMRSTVVVNPHLKFRRLEGCRPLFSFGWRFSVNFKRDFEKNLDMTHLTNFIKGIWGTIVVFVELM